MNSRSNNFIWACWMMTFGLFLTSCQDHLPIRPYAAPANSVDGTGGNKKLTCPAGQIAVATGSGDTATSNCQAPEVVRPTGAIKFKADFCACNGGKPISYGNCAAFCASKTAPEDVFYANFTTTEEISLSGLGNVYNWCTQILTQPASSGSTTGSSGSRTVVNPKCKLEARSEDGTASIDVAPIPGTNSITANLLGLAFDKTYIFTLVEETSGARSDSIQMIKFSQSLSIPILGPLKNAPISQYTCVIRMASGGAGAEAGDVFYDSAFRTHWYFLPRLPPMIIPPGNTSWICHDIYNPLYGVNDDELYPRLELIPGVFNLWDNTDPRFYDNNGDANKMMDVNEIIVQKTKNFGGNIPANSNFFTAFEQRTSLVDKNFYKLGFYMAPWINTTTYKSYCLTSTEYNSNNPLYKALRDIIGVDTEGLYAGQKAAETVSTGTSGAPATETTSPDTVLLRETDLKRVWFYLNNGVPTAPTDANVANVAVFFYYPLNFNSPYVRTSTQRLYRLKSAAELNTASSTAPAPAASSSSGAPSTYPPHDRKLGCIPKF